MSAYAHNAVSSLTDRRAWAVLLYLDPLGNHSRIKSASFRKSSYFEGLQKKASAPFRMTSSRSLAAFEVETTITDAVRQR